MSKPRLSPQKVYSPGAQGTGLGLELELYKEAKLVWNVGKALSNQLHLPRGQKGLGSGISLEPGTLIPGPASPVPGGAY